MTTRAELVQEAPAITAGLPCQMSKGVGIWRWAVEIADPLAGASIEWHDVTCDVLGASFTRGAGEYRGAYQASIADLELRADGDQYAPWNEDTSPTFGTHVELGPGVLVRLSYFRVSGGAVVEWHPRFTLRVEQWLDVTGGMGEIRRHPIVARDLSTELVNVPLPAVAVAESWYDRVLRIVSEAGWPYGVELFGAIEYTGSPVVELPARPEVPSAIAELDATLAPAGLTWYTSRRGVLTVRPIVGDLFHGDYLAAGATGTAFPEPTERRFSYFADTDGGISYAVGPNDVGPFGIDKTELNVINHVVVTDPDDPTPFDYDDPISVDRFGRKTRALSWLVANDDVAERIVDTRAYAIQQARPIMAQLGRIGFETGGVLDLDYLYPASVRHTTKEGREIVTASGNVRTITERVRPRSAEAIWLDVISILDIESTATTSSMLPVEVLAVSDITEDAATFTWNNPTQTGATPNATQIRIPQLSNLWVDIGYPVTEIDWGGLAPDTVYTFQVRLVEYADGNIVDASATRQIGFTTLASPDPVVTPGTGGGVDVVIPQEPDEGCDLEYELQRSADGTTWTTIDSGTNPAGGEVSFDGVLFDPEYTYRVRSREVCDGVPGPWYVSDVFLPECTTSGAYGSDDYADPTLMLYVPEICTPDVVRDAVSGDPAIHGPAWDAPTPDGTTIRLNSTTAAGGTVAYGDASGLENQYGSATLGCKVSVQTQETQRLVSIPGLRIDCVSEGSGWKARAGVTTVLGDEVTVESGELPLITAADLLATYDADTGELALFVDGSSVDTASVDEAAQRANAGMYWYTALPAASWITNIAAWSSVIVEGGSGSSLPDTIMALSPIGYWKLDEASGTTAVDSSGNGNDGTYAGTPTLQGWTGADGGQYVSLDAGTDFVAFGDLDEWSITDSGNGLSLFLILVPRINPATQTGYIWSKYSGLSDSRNEFRFLTEGGYGLYTDIHASNDPSYLNRIRRRLAGSNPLVEDTPEALLVVFDGATDSSSPTIYSSSGSLGGTLSSGSGYGSYANTAGTLRLGQMDRSSLTASLGLRSDVAHAAVFDYALDSSEASTLMSAVASDGWV